MGVYLLRRGKRSNLLPEEYFALCQNTIYKLYLGTCTRFIEIWKEETYSLQRYRHI
jgi:hypothetical protein